MRRLLVPLICAVLFAGVAYATYRVMEMYSRPAELVAVTMPEEPPVVEPPEVEPLEVVALPPRIGVGVDVELDRELTVREGELLLSGAVEELYPVLRPVRELELSLPGGASAVRLSPNVGWGVYFMLRDKTFLAEVPAGMIPDGRRIGLRVDGNGRVVGERPWFDLGTGKQLEEAAWAGRERDLFVPGGVHPVEKLRFEERYRELKCGKHERCGGTIVFSEYEKGKDEPTGGSVVTLGDEDTIHVYGYVIDPVAFTPDGLRYMVKKDR